MIIERLICVILGYFFGLFQTSYILGKSRGIDIRKHGSGNAGTTNALRTMGHKAGILTLLGDCCKCIIPMLAVKAFFSGSHPDMALLFEIYTAAGVILGHNFPFYLNFKGGKGVAATGGLLLAYHLPLAGICLLVFLLVVVVTKYVSLGSIFVYLVFLFGSLLLGELGHLPLGEGYLPEFYLIIVCLTLLMLFRHRANIKRLVTGTENKTYLGKKKEG